MTGVILLQHKWMCAVGGTMHCYFISHQCVGRWPINYYCMSPLCRVRTGALFLHRCVPIDDLCLITASVITVFGVKTDEQLLHRSSLCAEWWLKRYCCISSQSVRGDDWRTIAIPVIAMCGVLTRKLLLHQSSGMMIGALLLHQWLLCAEWWLVHYYWISRHCVRND